MKRTFLYLGIFSFLVIAISALLLLSGQGSSGLIYLTDACIHLGIFSAAMYLLWKTDLKTTLGSIGFPGGLKNTAIYTVLGLGAIFVILFVIGILALYLGFNDQQNITSKVNALHPAALFFAVIFAPMTEELFFRAFLVRRAGILLSALIFGILHIAYGSVVEVIGVTVVGLILGYVFVRSKSITPCIFAHMLYNLFSILVLKFLV